MEKLNLRDVLVDLELTLDAGKMAFRDKLLEDDAGSDSESIYELERIEGYKKWGKKEEFFVKWRGYSSAENTWEPLKNLTGVSIEEIEEARQKYSAKKAAPKRGSRKNGKDAQSSDTHSHVESELDAPAESAARRPRTLDSADFAEVEFIDAIEDGSMDDGSPTVEASIITSPMLSVAGLEEHDPSSSGAQPSALKDEPFAETSPVVIDEDLQPDEAVEDLDALQARLLRDGWKSPWRIPDGVDTDPLERLIQRNIQRFDLPPGVYGRASSVAELAPIESVEPSLGDNRRSPSGDAEVAPDPSQPSGSGLFGEGSVGTVMSPAKREKRRRKKKQKSEKREHRRSGKLRKMAERSGQEDVESPLHASRQAPPKPMELDLDEGVEEFHIPKWTGVAFQDAHQDDDGPSKKGGEQEEGEVVNLVATDGFTNEMGAQGGGSGDQPGTPKLQFDTSKPLKPELVLAASVLPPAVPNLAYRARVRTSVVKSVKPPLADIIGNCTDMRKVEVALKRYVDRKGLWWDWNYGKKSKLETGGGYVRVDLDSQLRQVCMCTLASFKEVLYHARRYVEVDETHTIEVDDEEEQLPGGGAVDRLSSKLGGSGSGGKKWKGGNKDWRNWKRAGNEPAWKSGGGSGKAGWKNGKSNNWDDWDDNDWKGWKSNDRNGKKNEWKNADRDWKESDATKKWTDDGGGSNSWGKSWEAWGGSKSWDDGKWGKDWSWGDDPDGSKKWQEEGDKGKWDKNRGGEWKASAAESPEWKPRSDWSDSELKCQWSWNDNQWKEGGGDEQPPSSTPKPLEVTEPPPDQAGNKARRYGSEDGDRRSSSVVTETAVMREQAGSEGEAMSIVDDEDGADATAPTTSPLPPIDPAELAQVTQSCHRLFWPLEDIQWLFDVTSPTDSTPSEAQSLLRELALNTVVVCPVGGLARYADGEGDIPGTVILRDTPEPVPVGGLAPSKSVEETIADLIAELVQYAAADLPELRHRIRAACDIIEFLDGAEWDEVVVLSTTSRGIAQAAIASNTACECTSSCGTGLLSASKSWCYVNPTSCGVGTCSCLSASKNPYDYCDDSLGLLERERARSQTEIEALRSKLNDFEKSAELG
ncbi:hypothetical protein FOZ60_015768 [Perkinsus olseni]|uniref:Chromo domain-containing protein n=1 Tax=Perkinsus olseni TaxID=32597 RepID=A0A7J6P5R0_PEROL|nr:hypothetical protein FOZ60_015768 [Perkinsus olseni]